jgi:hypothetical protein
VADGGAPDGGCAATDFDGRLRCIPGLTFTRTADGGFPGYARYDLSFRQPVDHFNPDAGTWPQRLFMLVKNPATDPMVLATTGYQLSTLRSDLTRVYAANQLTYEYRYFAASKPAGPTPWLTNTVRQAAEDAHRLVVHFRPLFGGNWVSTGISKGGMTATLHRRYYPNDVDATVAFVAPYCSSRTDPRYVTFLRQVGGTTWASCRQALTTFQHMALSRSAELLPLMPGSYTRLGKPLALEHAVIELSFGFWQYTSPASTSLGCSAIPGSTASATQVANFINAHVWWGNFTDSVIASYDSFYVTSAMELGGPEPDDAILAPLITQPGTYTYDGLPYLPPGFAGTYTYTPATQADAVQWVATQAERMMFVYGEYDPWTAGAYAPSPLRDNVVFTVPAGDHDIRIGDLPATQRAQAWATLDRWLGVTGVPTRAILQPTAPEPVMNARESPIPGGRPPF